MDAEINSYRVCNWFPEHGLHFIDESDRASFAALSPAGKVFRCVVMDGDWLLLEYGVNTYRANIDVFKKVSAPAFRIGQRVLVNGRRSTVALVTWHFKNEAPIYLLAFDGKQSSRRYGEAELELAE
jgi:hypothetical protein